MMKLILHITAIIFAALCFSCSNSSLSRRLDKINNLIDVDADNALVMLNNLVIDTTKISENTQNYYNLLRVKAADKAGHEHTSDSLINDVIKYYEDCSASEKLIEAYYYAGRCNIDVNRLDKSFYYFQLAFLENSKSESKSDDTQKRIFDQMGYLYKSCGLPTYAKNMFLSSQTIAKNHGDSTDIDKYAKLISEIDTIIKYADYDPNIISINTLYIQKAFEKARGHNLFRQKSALQLSNFLAHRVYISIIVIIILILGALLFVIKRSKSRKVKSRNTFYDKDISDMLASLLSNGKIIKPTDWALIESQVCLTFPEFKEKLFSIYPFSETEYHICLLIKAGVSPTNIAKLTAATKSAISQSRLRMHKKVFGVAGSAKDWDEYIISL